MEKSKNQKLTIIVGALLVVIGISFAYFMASLLIDGDGASTKVTTARISGATLHVEGTIDMESDNMLPGHKAVSAVKVTATGNNQLIAYNLIWIGTNGISQLNYKVYKSSNPLTPKPTTSCTPTTKVEGGVQQLSETCSISNFEGIGEPIASGSINKGDTKVVLVEGEFITATSGGTSWYYYVVLEYLNLEIDQSGDIGASISGEVTVEESDKEADINILAVYLQDDEEDTKYNEINDIPKKGEGYSFKRAECSNEATATWNSDNWNITIDNLTQSGTSCNLYFDKLVTRTSTQMLEALGISSTPTAKTGGFNNETTTGGMFSAEDDYGTSYYWRGPVQNNYLMWAEKCWRIVRINGDGSLRIIYDGSTCHENGVSGQSGTDSMAKVSQPYNAVWNDNTYVGYMKSLNTTANGQENTTSANAHANTYNSDIKTALETWYDENIAVEGKSYTSDIAEDAGFCNDRGLGSGYESAGYGTQRTNYKAYDRINGKTGTDLIPTLLCANKTRDLFTPKNTNSTNKGNKLLEKPIGLITADEVVFAGSGVGSSNFTNKNYYLYNGNYYWTMSPYYYGTNAVVFSVYSSGNLYYNRVDDTSYGARPVINLKSDIAISNTGTGEKGTISNPYRAG